MSIFCPNQGDTQGKPARPDLAIRQIYASVFGLDALMYRRRVGLLDYDERMAILLQEVQGERHRQYYFPVWPAWPTATVLLCGIRAVKGKKALCGW